MNEVVMCSKDIVELWIFDHPVIDGRINADFSVYRVYDDLKVIRNIIASKTEDITSVKYNVEDDLPQYRNCTFDFMVGNLKEAVNNGFSAEVKFANNYIKYVIFASDDMIFIVDENKRGLAKAQVAQFDIEEFCNGCTTVEFNDALIRF
jgi:hypothetical protein